MTDPTQGETRELIEAIKELVPLLSRAAAETPATPRIGEMHNIMMAPPDSGERAVHRVEKANYMLVGLFVGLLIGGWTLLDRLSADARDLKREQQRTADYQAMLWQRYPELRPENLKPNEDKKP